MNSRSLKLGALFVLFVIVVVTPVGCASYHAHYGRIEALNSQGEKRKFLLVWESEASPVFGTKTSAILLKSQCSERVIQFRDAGSKRRACGGNSQGIFACLEKDADLPAPSGRILPEDVCGEITDQSGSHRIKDLNRQVKLTIQCRPKALSKGEGEDKVGLDYLGASQIPYVFYVKKADLYSLTDKPPALSDKVCDLDG